MKGTKELLLSSQSDELGATAVEYAIMVALIAVVIIVAVTAVGTNLTASFECSASAVGDLPNVNECVK